MSRPTLYILCGLPFSGKSTLAKAIVAKFGFEEVTLDQINSEKGIGLEVGSKPLSPEEWEITHNESYKRTENFLKEGKTIIYDATNFTRELRDKLRLIAEKAGCQSKVIYIDIPEPEVRRRWLNNKDQKIRFDLREEDVAHVANNFQVPTVDENVIIYNQSLPLAEWLQQNISQN